MAKKVMNYLRKEVTVGKVIAIGGVVCCSALCGMVIYFTSKRTSLLRKFVEVNTQDIDDMWEELKKSIPSPEDYLEKEGDKISRRIDDVIRQCLEKNEATRKAQDEDLRKEDKEPIEGEFGDVVEKALNGNIMDSFKGFGC